MYLIVDSNYLFHRTRHALHDVSLSNEYIRTEIIYGFLRLLLKISSRLAVDHWAFVWDSKISWRENQYPNYKANRKKLKQQQFLKMTDEEREIHKIQFKQAEDLKWQILPNLGFKNNFHQAGAEGDDLIASIIINNPKKTFIILATDKDLYQLLSDNVLIFNGHTEKIITVQSFIKRYNIPPSSWSLAKAIGGCNTDGVEGIKGCADPAKSEKSRALTYIRREMKHGTIFDRIESDMGQQIIERNKYLVCLPHQNTMDIKLRPHSLFAGDFIKVFEQYDFQSFLKRSEFREWEYTFNLI